MNITDLIRLGERATPGPWAHDGQVVAADTREEIASWIYKDADAVFIVALRNAWPRLLKVVEAAKACDETHMVNIEEALMDLKKALRALEGT